MSIFYGGPIITSNNNQPLVDSVGIEGDKILATGSFEEVKQKMKKNIKLINLEGKTLLPGFIESHMHPITLLFFMLNVDLSVCKSLIEVQDVIIKMYGNLNGVPVFNEEAFNFLPEFKDMVKQECT